MKPIYLLLFGLILISYASAQSQTSSYILASGQTKNMTLFLDNGDHVTGSINVTGGDETIYLSVKDPTGKEILPNAKVTRGGTITFAADQSGAYTMIFDNSQSTEGKNIVISYSTTYVSPIDRSQDNCYSWFFIPGLIFAAFVFRRR